MIRNFNFHDKLISFQIAFIENCYEIIIPCFVEIEAETSWKVYKSLFLLTCVSEDSGDKQ